MADPKWIDTQTLSYVASGDTTLESELLAQRAAGVKFLIVPKVYEEATVGNPFSNSKKAVAAVSPEREQAIKGAMQRLGAEIDRSGSSTDRLGDRQYERDGAGRELRDRVTLDQPGLVDRGWVVKKSGVTRSVLSESDSLVLSQVAASARARGVSQPVILSADGGVRTNAERWGVKAEARKSVPAPKGAASTGQAEKEPVVASGGRGAELGDFVAGSHAVIKNGLNQISQQTANDEAMAEYQRRAPEMLGMLKGSPGQGVRVDFFFTFQPGVNRDFNDTWTFEGLTYAPYPGLRQELSYDLPPRGERRSASAILPALPPRPRVAAAPGGLPVGDVELAGDWQATIGPWSGVFEFDGQGNVSWMNNLASVPHPGRWSFDGTRLSWTFLDDPPNFSRLFVVRPPLKRTMQGVILPLGRGAFEMTKTN
jgi:hypothetical protein